MQTYKIAITETFTRLIDVEAPDVIEAQQIAEKQYLNGQIVIDKDDYENVYSDFTIEAAR